jgi:hypothetical protein
MPKIDRQKPNESLVAEISAILPVIHAAKTKKAQEYPKLKELLRPNGYKPFDIFATYNYLTGSAAGDWEASVKLAAYVAQRRKAG